MLERFTRDARAAVRAAHEEARRLGHPSVGTEHLLLALFTDGSGAGAVLTALGVSAERVERELARLLGPAGGGLGEEDAAALRAIGIDLDEVRARLAENFGPVPLAPPPQEPRRGFFRRRRDDGPVGGHIRFSRRARKVLELSLREAIRLGHRDIAGEHLLLGLVREGEGLGAKILVVLGVDLGDLRERAVAALRTRPETAA
jgi:ATP-dependent Clp protease ATP-binding subunit ClpA